MRGDGERGLQRRHCRINVLVVVIGTKPTITVIRDGFVILLHPIDIYVILSFVVVSTGVQYVPARVALARCIVVCAPRVIEVFCIDTKVWHLGDHQL